ncbi:MAG TPA: YncE family protein [Pyrinomonadaceae bacterium]|jgi:YVTN family beta-propeller protein
MFPNTNFFRFCLFLLVAFAASATNAFAAPQCRLYVSDYNTATVRALDCTDNKNTPMPAINVGQKPFGIVSSPDGSRVYVANYESNSVSVIDTSNNSVVHTIDNVGVGPIGVALSPDGHRLYVANFDSHTVAILSVGYASNPYVVSTVQFPDGSRPDNVAFSADGARVYVARWGDNKVSMLDATSASNQILKDIDVGHQPSAIAVSADGKRVFVTNEFGQNASGNLHGSVSVIDSSPQGGNNVVATWPLPDNTFPMQQIALSANGRYLYVPGHGNAQTFMIDTDTGAIETNTQVGVQPFGAAFSPDGSRFYVSHGNAVSVLETGWNKLLMPADITLGGATSWLLNMAVAVRCP